MFSRTTTVGDPDLRPIPHERLTAGLEIGWLTVLDTSDQPWRRIPVQCRCGARLTPRSGHVATGRVRHCGQTTVHAQLAQLAA